MEHTELPWKHEEGTESSPPALVMNTETYICQTVGGNDNANAAFIVKAVNEYYPMQKIIKALVEKLDDDVWALELSGHEIACVQSIKEAIKHAEESE